eukprot:2247448-Rhodomonas_salina.1
MQRLNFEGERLNFEACALWTATRCGLLPSQSAISAVFKRANRGAEADTDASEMDLQEYRFDPA